MKNDGHIVSKIIFHIVSVIVFYSLIYILFFSPVVFFNKLLAPGDGIVQNLPNFYSPVSLWTDALYGGFPVAADPQAATWYPIALIFRLIPDSWNVYVISAYLLASCFTYGYVFTITKSRLGASAAGIIYGMSGFMMAHLGHTNMIHAVCWMPLSIWALEKLRAQKTRFWSLVLIISFTCTILAGHAQTSLYSMGLSTIYALTMGRNASIGRGKYYQLFFWLIFLSIGLSSILIIPTFELSKLSVRSHINFQEFNSFSLPFSEISQLLFPYIFGGKPAIIYSTPYFGSWGLTETTGYVGLLTILLATIGFISYRQKKIAKFWLIVALVTLVLTLGDATFLSWLTYQIPLYNKFRGLARHFIEMTLAVSVLAGMGISAIQNHLLGKDSLKKVILGFTGIFTIGLTFIFLSFNRFKNLIQSKYGQFDSENFTLIPWQNLAVGIPIIIFIFAIITLFYWSKSPQSKVLQVFTILVLLLDLSSFGWFYEWQYSSPSKKEIIATDSTLKYQQILNKEQQRILTVRGVSAEREQIPPNLSRLWKVPNASGYNPLILKRISKLLDMGGDGIVSGFGWINSNNHNLDIMSVRYVFIPKKNEPKLMSDPQDFRWLQEDLGISLGSGCGIEKPKTLKLQVSEPINADAIGIVSSLSCSGSVPDNSDILSISVKDSQLNTAELTLKAGRDTSEWAYDCSNVLPYIKHSKAKVFESFETERGSSIKCEGHKYVSILPLNHLNNIKNINLDYQDQSGTSIDIQKISLINTKTKEVYPIGEASSLLTDESRWHKFEELNNTIIYENKKAMPRIWLVPEVVTLTAEEVLKAIKTSELPGMGDYNPSQLALIEDSFNFKVDDFDRNYTVKILNQTDTRIEIQTHSNSPAFLILSDVYYPGWKASIDGKKTRVFQTNYISRGIALPQGDRLVKFEFKPLSFHLGLGISLASLFVLVYFFRVIY